MLRSPVYDTLKFKSVFFSRLQIRIPLDTNNLFVGSVYRKKALSSIGLSQVQVESWIDLSDDKLVLGLIIKFSEEKKTTFQTYTKSY